MLFLLAFAAAAALAAPIDKKLLFQPVDSKGSSSFSDAHSAATFSQFQSILGGETALSERKEILRSLSASQHFPELREDKLAIQAKMAERMEGAVFDRASIVDINKPIADYLYEADIMLSPEDLERIRARTLGSSLSSPRHKRGAPVVTSGRWPKTQPIAFIFNDDIVDWARDYVRVATKKIEANTCLSFKENGSVGTQLQFHKGVGCWSKLGYQNTEKQLISIGAGCGSPGIISHEIFHALGVGHTQTRKDRDSFVQVNPAAIIPDKLFNFAKYSDEENDNFGVPYEYGSGMHYGAYAFTISYDQAALVPNDPDFVNTMGQNMRLTFNDFKLVNALYECSANCPKQLPCQNGGYTSPKDCNVCACNEFYTGVNCETAKITIPITATDAGKTTFHQDRNKTIFDLGEHSNWEMFGKDAAKVIKAPTGKKILVTINKVYTSSGDCKAGCPFGGFEFVDTANGDLSSMGKIYCCSSKDNGISFVSKTNVIGYRAYASPGSAFDGDVTYTVV